MKCSCSESSTRLQKKKSLLPKPIQNWKRTAKSSIKKKKSFSPRLTPRCKGIKEKMKKTGGRRVRGRRNIISLGGSKAAIKNQGNPLRFLVSVFKETQPGGILPGYADEADKGAFTQTGGKGKSKRLRSTVLALQDRHRKKVGRKENLHGQYITSAAHISRREKTGKSRKFLDQRDKRRKVEANDATKNLSQGSILNLVNWRAGDNARSRA